MTEHLELYAALEAIAAGDMTREAMIQCAKEAIGDVEEEEESNA